PRWTPTRGCGNLLSIGGLIIRKSALQIASICNHVRGGKSIMSGATYRYALAALVHVLFVLVWFLFVKFGQVPSFILPSPLGTIATLGDVDYHWLSNTLVTASEVFGGYFLGVAVGVAIAIAFSWSRTAETATMPLLVTLNMVPKVALGPLFIVWLSYGIIP